MPFCPNCRSEYRAGFSECKTCGGIALVEELPELDDLAPGEIEGTRPVGYAIGERIGQIGDREIDVFRVYFLGQASEIDRKLRDAKIPSIIVPLDVVFPDDQARFEVRVREADHERAEAHLRSVFASLVANEEADEGLVGGTDAESCPACGAHVPLDVEECPECGLNVGGA
jgi:hypothetical protein